MDDQLGSKVTANLWRVSLVMFLSVVRLRLVHSPLYNWLRPSAAVGNVAVPPPQRASASPGGGFSVACACARRSFSS